MCNPLVFCHTPGMTLAKSGKRHPAKAKEQRLAKAEGVALIYIQMADDCPMAGARLKIPYSPGVHIHVGSHGGHTPKELCLVEPFHKVARARASGPVH